MNDEKRKTLRVSLDLSKSTFDKLEELERMTDSGSKAAVIRQAIQILEYIVIKTEEGSEFRFVDKDGTERNLVILGIK